MTAGPSRETSQPSLLAEHSHLAPSPSVVVFSGGTAFNGVAAHFKHLTHRVTHVLPVSDDGGSTAEIVRVLGGPAVGDIRSRCLRLAEEGDEEVCLALQRDVCRESVGRSGCGLTCHKQRIHAYLIEWPEC